MRVALGSRGDYTVRAVLYLARHTGLQRRQSISEAMHIPDAYLTQIMGPLVRGGVVRSSIGRIGGYELIRPPATLTLLEVVEIAEGPIGAEAGLHHVGPPEWDGEEAVHDAWQGAWAALVERLDRTTFDQLVGDVEGARAARDGEPAIAGLNRLAKP
jgi:Rrf2 family protein